MRSYATADDDDGGMGRWSGLTTKIHALVDAEGRQKVG